MLLLVTGRLYMYPRAKSKWVPLQDSDRLFAVNYPNNEKNPLFENVKYHATVLSSVVVIYPLAFIKLETENACPIVAAGIKLLESVSC